MTPYVVAFASILGIAGALGIVYAVFRSASDQKRRDLDRELIDSQDKAIAFAEKERARLQARVDTLTTELAGLSTQIGVLQNNLTQRAEVEKLRKEIHDFYRRQSERESEQREEHAAHLMILKDLIAQLKRRRGQTGGEIG